MQVLIVEFIIKPEPVTAFHAAIVSNAQVSVTQQRGRAMRALTAGWFESKTVMRLERAAP